MDKKQCKHCGKKFAFNPNKQGPTPTYCSASCVVMACRKRKKQKASKVTPKPREQATGKTRQALRGKTKRRPVHIVDQELFNLRKQNRELIEKLAELQKKERENRVNNRTHLATIYRLKKQMRNDGSTPSSNARIKKRRQI